MTCRANIKTKIGMLFSALTLSVAPMSTSYAIPANVDWKSNGPALIGKNNGIAGLDGSGVLQYPINSTLTKIIDTNKSVVFGGGINVPGSDMFSGLESTYLGGIQNNNFSTTDFTYSVSQNLYSEQGLKISANPYGAFDAGTSLSVFTEEGPISGLRAGVSGGDYREGPSVQSAVGSFDLVGFYEDVANNKARLVVSDVTYDATHVYMPGCGPNAASGSTCVPLGKGDMAKLHRGMYIVTNSIDATTPITSTNGNFPNYNPYAGYVDGWDPSGKYITVNSWAMLGGSNTAKGQVPSTTYENYWSTRSVPTIFIGSPTKAFGRNLFLHYNESDSIGNNTSVIHSYSGEELDIRGTVSKSRSLNMSGIVISGYIDDTTANGDGLTAESTGLFVGGPFPVLFKGDPASRAVVLNTGNSFIGSPDNNFSDSTTLGTYDTLSEFSSVGDDVMGGLSMRVEHNRSTKSSDSTTKTSIASQDDDYAFGLVTRPSYRDTSGYTIGRQDTVRGFGAKIKFSPLADYAISLCGANTASSCGLTLNSSGNIHLSNVTTIDSLVLGSNINLGSNSINTAEIFTSSASKSSDGKSVGGQGTYMSWNIQSGAGDTELYNINPGAQGGYAFYDVATGTNISDYTALTPLLRISKATGAVFDETLFASSNSTALKIGSDLLISKDKIETVSTNVAAAGSSLRDATPISSHYTLVTKTTSASGVRLPTCTVGKSFVVFNDGATDFNIYPDTETSYIEEDVDTLYPKHYYVTSPGKVTTFVCVGANMWHVM